MRNVAKSLEQELQPPPVPGDLNSLIFGPDELCSADVPEKRTSHTGMGISTCWFDNCVSPLFDAEEGADDQLLGCGAWQEDHGEWARVQGVVDSGACKPVAPPSMAPGFPVRQNADSRSGKAYASASGFPLHNLGEQLLSAVTDQGVQTEVLFQLADVSCPLISVSQICDHGNRVIFGRGGGVILNLLSGAEIPFKREGGVYALGLWMRRGDPRVAKENAKLAEERAAAAAKKTAFARR